MHVCGKHLGIIVCDVCGATRGADIEFEPGRLCPRCVAHLTPWWNRGIDTSWFLFCVALLLLIPSFFLPIMSAATNSGNPVELTIFDYLSVLWNQGRGELTILLSLIGIVFPLIRVTFLLLILMMDELSIAVFPITRLRGIRSMRWINYSIFTDAIVMAGLAATLDFYGHVKTVMEPGYLFFLASNIAAAVAFAGYDTRRIWLPGN